MLTQRPVSGAAESAVLLRLPEPKKNPIGFIHPKSEK
jgi:hypothetical protein